MKTFLGFIILILTSTICIAQNITGVVLDSNNQEPLPGANIFLQSNWSIGSTADANGKFTLNITNNTNSDTLIISYIGYKDKYIPIKDIHANLTIELESFSHMLEASFVTARRIIAEEFTVKQMKQMDIYLNPAAKADPLLAINAMASSTTTDESASLSIRGSRPDETGIFLNDVPIYDAIRFSQLDGIGTFSIFNTDVIERMHVFPGNPPLEFGNTASGLVSLQSNNQIPTESVNTIALSLANIGALTSRKLNDKTAIVAFGNYQPSQIFTGLNQDAMRDLESFSSYDFGVHLIHNFNSKLRVKIFNYSNVEGYEFNTSVPSFTGIFDMGKKRNFTIANFISQFDHSEFTVNTGYNISSESYKFSITDINIDKQDLYLSSSYQHFFNKWSLKTGLSYDYRVNNSDGTKPLYYYAQGLNHPVFSFNQTEEYKLPELFVYSKINLTDHLVLGTGIRKNIAINNTPDYLSYQGNINYKMKEKHNINFSAGHYNKLSMPNAEQYGINHFKSNQYSLDYTFDNDVLLIQTSVFKKDVDYASYKNNVIGAELYTKLNIKPVEFQFSITSLDAQIKNDTKEYPSQYDLDYFIRSVLKYSIKDAFEISAIYIFRQGSYYQTLNYSSFDSQTQTYFPVYNNRNKAERLPDYHKIDLSVSKYWVINPKLAIVLYANISNLFNTDNVMELNYNYDYSESFKELYSQRTIYFGASIMF